jgi:hypothetical protein
MAKVKKNTAEEPMDDWEAREDAQAMARHHEVRQDPKRHARAVAAAAKMHQDRAEEAAAMKKVTHSKPLKTDEKVRSMAFKK